MKLFTNTELAAEAEREIKMRRRVYAGRAPGGLLSPAQQRQIAMMEEIAAHYRELAKQERMI